MKNAIKDNTLFPLDSLLLSRRPTARLTNRAQNGKAKINPPVYPIKCAMPPTPLKSGKPNAASTITTAILRKALRGVKNNPANRTANVCNVMGTRVAVSRILKELM